MKNIYEAMDEALALVPVLYPRRSELIADLYEFKNQSPEGDPTMDEVKECFRYYLGSFTGVAWKRKIEETLEV